MASIILKLSIQLLPIHLDISMSFLEHGLRAKVMSTELIIEANLSKKILFEALEIAKEFERKYSAYQEESLLCHINAHSGMHPTLCTPDELEIFHLAKKIAQQSNGRFDPTIGSLTQGLYGFGKKEARIPKPDELNATQALVNYKNIILDNQSIFLQKKGMKLDLGGIGKGYVADKIFSFLSSKGATKILICVGGEIAATGKVYKIAIKNPFNHGNMAIVTTTKEQLSISTSGDYERFIGSRLHHHILDNKTAKQNHFYASITIIKNDINTTLLDAVATIAFNAPLNQLEAIAQKFDVAIIAITPQKKIVVENFQNLALENLELFPF